MTADREPAERIRCREVSRLLSGTNLSPDKERVVERLSRSLVSKLLCGPIAEAMARTDIGKNLGPEAAALERHRQAYRAANTSQALRTALWRLVVTNPIESSNGDGRRGGIELMRASRALGWGKGLVVFVAAPRGFRPIIEEVNDGVDR